MLWRRLKEAYDFGDVLVTLGTGRLTEIEEEGMGLAGEHDYAVIDYREAGGERFLLVKNPWSKATVWKGSTAYANSKDELNAANGAAVVGALTYELMPGSFWMGLNDLFQSFESMYLNWNPALFSHREDIHFTWDLCGSRSPPGSLLSNPQYEISSSTCDVVWLLLSKHLVSRPQISDSGESDQSSTSGGYISLYVYENSGERVYTSDNALMRGPYVDSPNNLLKLEPPPNAALTIVISEQALPPASFHFTLSAFSNERLTFRPAGHKYEHRILRQGAWTRSSCGGNANSSRYLSNPSFSFRLERMSDVALLLEAEQEYPVHVKLLWPRGCSGGSVSTRDILGDSGESLKGYAFAEIANVEPGRYTIVCSTFDQGQFGKFDLNILTFCPCTVERVLPSSAGRLVSRLETAFQAAGNNRLLAPLLLTRVTRLRLVARWTQDGTTTAQGTHSLLKVGLEYGQGPSMRHITVSGHNEYLSVYGELETPDADLQPRMCQQGGLWIVIERLGRPALHHAVEAAQVEVLSDATVEIGQWRIGDD